MREVRIVEAPFVTLDLCLVGKVYKVGAMAGIARNIELYNLVYSLAWKHISEHQKHERPDIARRLHDSIRRLLNDGETEPVFIASEALKAFEESERETPKAESAKPDSRLSRHN